MVGTLHQDPRSDGAERAVDHTDEAGSALKTLHFLKAVAPPETGATGTKPDADAGGAPADMPFSGASSDMGTPEQARPVEHTTPDPTLRHATVKWFDLTRGFGFAVSMDGDIFVHHSVLRPLGRRSLPEGARIVCRITQGQRGLHAMEVISFDLSTAIGPDPEQRADQRKARADPHALLDRAGPFEPVTLKWFNRVKGFGFVVRPSSGLDAFLHMETLRHGGIVEISPETQVEARLAESGKGLLVVAIRKVD